MSAPSVLLVMQPKYSEHPTQYDKNFGIGWAPLLWGRAEALRRGNGYGHGGGKCYVMTEHRLTQVFEGYNNVCIISRSDGDDHAFNFLKEIDDKDAGKFNRYLERLRDGLHVKSPENMRHIKVADPKKAGAEVHELKVHRNGGLRLYLVRFENRWYITHGVKKVADSKVPKEAAKAFALFWNEQN